MSINSVLKIAGALLVFTLSFWISNWFFEQREISKFWESIASKDLGDQVGYLGNHDSAEFAEAAFEAGS